ncbi:hypothetical protein [Aeromonas sp.]|uniref:hypothetical protein n=1 Tax=Aeromonas sp. TaxID=647 RepID=UPI002587BFA3|nr:hypothetical protein [Aeromonas sp.]MCX7132305.1 hypothetical protein [Aeromonas sp.]
MSKHTKEPWPFFADWAEPSTPHPESEPIVRLGYEDYQRARYCVNACQWVSNGQLTLTSVIGAILMLKEAEQQCDELLAALDTIGTHTITEEDGSEVEVLFGDIDKIRDAIAKAKGGAA